MTEPAPPPFRRTALLVEVARLLHGTVADVNPPPHLARILQERLTASTTSPPPPDHDAPSP